MKNTQLSLLMSLIALSLIASSASSEYEHGTQIALPEGALARLGKGRANEITFSPDGNTLAVAGSIGVWLYDVRTPIKRFLCSLDTLMMLYVSHLVLTVRCSQAGVKMTRFVCGISPQENTSLPSNIRVGS